MDLEVQTKSNERKEEPSLSGRNIIIIDGFNTFLRFFAVNESLTTDGELCGGTVGFLKFLFSITTRFSPSKVYVVWEQGGGSSRRKKIFPEYKANRAKLKDNFQTINKDKDALPSKRWIMGDQQNKLKQIKQAVECIKFLPVCQIYVADTECDDIIAYLLKDKFKSLTNVSKILVSTDKDFYQLLNDPTLFIYDMAKKILVNEKYVFEKFSISPVNFALAKTLAGDDSDNIPGVPGVGFKTVVKRFPKMAERTSEETISSILEACQRQVDQKSKIKIYQSILESKEILKRNWDLMYLSSSTLSGQQIAKIDYAVDNFKPVIDKLGLIKCLLGAKIVTDINFDVAMHQMKISLLTSS